MPERKNALKDWFSRTYMYLESLPPMRLGLLLLSVGVLFSLIGLGGGVLIINGSETLRDQPKELPRVEKRVQVEEKVSPEEAVSLAGIIKPNPTANTKATHSLSDDKGNVIAYLVSNDAKLDLVIDSKVEVRGQYTGDLLEGVKILRVAKIVFK